MPESMSPNPAADEALSAVMSGELWSEFCDQLKATGQQILREEAPGDPLHRAEGWRYQRNPLAPGRE